MNKKLLFKSLERYKGNSIFSRKMKLLAALAGICFCLIVIFTVWSAVYLANQVLRVATDGQLKTSVESQLVSVSKNIESTNFKPIDCWGKVQTYLAIEPWLSNSIAENINHLKTACFNRNETKCPGGACDNENKNAQMSLKKWEVGYDANQV